MNATADKGPKPPSHPTLTCHIDPTTVSAGESVRLSVTVNDPPKEGYMLTLWAKGKGQFRKAAGDNLEEAEKDHRQFACHIQQMIKKPENKFSFVWDAAAVPPDLYRITVFLWKNSEGAPSTKEFVLGSLTLLNEWGADVEVTAAQKEAVSVTLRRAASSPTEDQALWTVIRQSANALSFKTYNAFMDDFLCSHSQRGLSADQHRKATHIQQRLTLPFPDTDAYRQLKVATEVFLMAHCGVAFNIDFKKEYSHYSSELASERRRYNDPTLQPRGIENLWRNLLSQEIATDGAGGGGKPVQTLPYLAIVRRKLNDVTVVDHKADGAATECLGILMDKLTQPCLIELIWSYWHEEGMLAQTMNALTWRFQNRRGPADRDPLALLEIDPLRPLNNFIWGYVQDEQHRLTVPRRAYEYDHHYGLTLQGKAVPQVRGADSRSRFLEGFHNLLFRCSLFFKEDDDTTVVADGFPVLNALKEVHLQLTQGAHNQYGDLPWTARHEMLMQQWLLARPEFREFLPSRIMVDYPEPWMDRVETMKTLQGWTDTSVMHFRDLGVFGEQILLGVRFGAWPSIIEPESAANWARYWRPEIQGYIHAYRAVTGVDLTERVDATPPSILLLQRLNASGTRALPSRRVAVARMSQPQRTLR